MPGHRKRLFFAAIPDQEVREQLAMLAEQHHQRLAHRHHPLDLHLTLAFLGMQPQERLDDFRTLAEMVDTDAFQLQIDQVGYWKAPKILWAAPSHTPQPLTDLVDSLWQGLTDLGLERDTRPYRPHITLQRKARHLKTTQIDPIVWKIDSFSLVWSQDIAEPPRYQTLENWSLRTDS